MNVAHSVSISGPLNESVFVCVWVCVCVSQHLRVEMSQYTLLQGHARRKSCNWLEHPVLDVNSVLQAFLPVLEKQSVLSFYFGDQPSRRPMIMRTRAFLMLKGERERYRNRSYKKKVAGALSSFQPLGQT